MMRRARVFFALLGVAGCDGESGPTDKQPVAPILAQTVVRPSVIATATPFDVEITATNVSSASVALTVSSGCTFAYEVQAADGRVVAAPVYPCTSVMRSLSLAAGEVLRESYQFDTGQGAFPQLAPGRYRIVPTLSMRGLAGVEIRGADVEVR